MKDETYETVIEALTDKINRLEKQLMISETLSKSYKRDLETAIEQLKEQEVDLK